MRTVNIILPKKWIDLSPRQLLFVAKLFLSDFAKTHYRFLTHALLFFTNTSIKKTILKDHVSNEYVIKQKGEKAYKISAQQLQFVASKLNWLLQQVTEIKPLPKLRRAKPVHYRLYKTKFIQFLTAENFYKAYTTTKDPAHLDALVATLYQKAGQTFNDDLVKQRATYFRWVRLQKKYTVYLWYSGFRWYVSQQCPNLFSKSGTGEELKIKDHVMNMIRGLTEGDVTKNNHVLHVDTWEALLELDAKAKDAKKLKEQTEKTKSNVQPR